MQIPSLISKNQIYQGHHIVVHKERIQLEPGHTVDLDIVRHPGAAAIVPVDANGDVIMVRQYRHAAGEWMLEIPAGTFDGKEPPLSCAQRELAEETGMTAERFEAMGFVFTSPGFCDERIYLFVAEGLTPGQQNLDADEVLTVERVPMTEAVAMAVDGRITDAKSVCGLLRAQALVRGR